MRKCIIVELIVIFTLIILGYVAVSGTEKVVCDKAGKVSSSSDGLDYQNQINLDAFNQTKVDLVFCRVDETNKNAFYDSNDVRHFDVYVDNFGTEYYYLSGTDDLCGYLYENVGNCMDGDSIISEKTALEEANNLLSSIRDKDDYVLSNCVFNELGGYYDIEFSYVINGYKTNDIFRLWINTEGKITAFSEFNHNLYDNYQLEYEDYEKAKSLLTDKIDENVNDYTIFDSYITTDKDNHLILVMLVDIKCCADNGSYKNRVLFYENI